MIGRKIPSAGKSKSFEYDVKFKRSTRVARQKRRARRARKLRNGWMFGRKIRVGTQLYPVKFLDFPTPEPPEPEIVYVRDKDGVERRLRAFSCSYPRPEPKGMFFFYFFIFYHSYISSHGSVQSHLIAFLLLKQFKNVLNQDMMMCLSFLVILQTIILMKLCLLLAMNLVRSPLTENCHSYHQKVLMSPRSGKQNVHLLGLYMILTVFLRGALFLWRSLWFLMMVHRDCGSRVF